MNIKNMSEKDFKRIEDVAKDIDLLQKNPNAKTKYLYEEIKGYATVEERQKASEDYIYELFSITEDQSSEIEQLKAKMAKLEAINQNLTAKLAAVGKIVQSADMQQAVVASQETTKMSEDTVTEKAKVSEMIVAET